MTRLKRELAVLCGSTSVKGVPRAAKAPTRPLRILWIISTLFFIGLTTWQVTAITLQYLNYEYLTRIIEGVLSETTDDHIIVVAPSVTVCNLNPFSGNASDITTRNNYTRVKEFAEFVKERTTCDSCSEEDQLLLKHIQNDLLTAHGYYMFLGKQNALSLGHKKKDSVIECYIQKREGFRAYKEECSVNASLEVLTDYMFYNCFTLNTSMIQTSNTVMGFGIAMHLDNYFQEHYDYLNMQHDYSQHLGAVLVVHGPGKRPMLRRDALFLPPGSYMDVTLQIEQHNRLKSPYGSCKKPFTKVPGTDWQYTVDACVSVCLEELIASDCECRDLFTLNLLEDKYSNLSYCSDPNRDVDSLLWHTRCAQYVRDNHTDRCTRECPNPCLETQYRIQLSQAAWPPNPFHTIFYDDYVRNRDYEWRYRRVQEIMNTTDQDWSLKRLGAMLQVSRNFLHSDVYLGGTTYINYTDTEHTTPEAFLSQLGGVLNLFSGITIVIFIEFIDFLLRLCFNFGEPSSNKNGTRVRNTQATDVWSAPLYNYSNVKWPLSHLNLPDSGRFVQQFAQTDIKENINAPHHWPFMKGIHRPLTKGQ